LHTWVGHFNEQIDSVARRAVGGDISQLNLALIARGYLGRPAVDPGGPTRWDALKPLPNTNTMSYVDMVHIMSEEVRAADPASSRCGGVFVLSPSLSISTLSVSLRLSPSLLAVPTLPPAICCGRRIIPRPVRLGTPIARVHGGVVFEVAVCDVRALALSVAHSRPCASVVVLSCKKYGPGGT
jgi:hypothetical protein